MTQVCLQVAWGWSKQSPLRMCSLWQLPSSSLLSSLQSLLCPRYVSMSEENSHSHQSQACVLVFD